MRDDGKVSSLIGQCPPDRNLLTADEVAVILRVAKSWVYSHLRDLPAIRLGRYVRFRRSDIDEFLASKGSCQ